jgi:hypothetical protein
MNEMTINLEDYIGKTVEVELRNGNVVRRGKVHKYSKTYHIGFPYFPYNKHGLYTSVPVLPDDIIKIKEIKETPTEPETMTNVIRSKNELYLHLFSYQNRNQNLRHQKSKSRLPLARDGECVV